MKDFSQHDEDRDQELDELLQRYENLRKGEAVLIWKKKLLKRLLNTLSPRSNILRRSRL